MPVEDGNLVQKILKGIYGNRAGGFYEFGLFEATFKSVFAIKHFSSKGK